MQNKECARAPRPFKTIKTALEAAKGLRSIDYQVAIDGDCRHPSQWALDEGALETELRNSGFKEGTRDVINVWLPVEQSEGKILKSRVTIEDVENSIWS